MEKVGQGSSYHLSFLCVMGSCVGQRSRTIDILHARLTTVHDHCASEIRLTAAAEGQGSTDVAANAGFTIRENPKASALERAFLTLIIQRRSQRMTRQCRRMSCV